MSDIDRKTLAAITNMVRPALATVSYVPALTHICFDGEQATAFNDIAAIWVRAEMEYQGCLPGEQLIRTLGTFSSDKVNVELLDDGSTMLKSGRSKIKMPTLGIKDFPMPKLRVKDADFLPLDADIIKGIKLCLMNVGNDPTHAAQMGVTLDIGSEGQAVLFSTDNATISRYQTKTDIELPGDSPIIMPTFFCQQLIGLWEVFKEEDCKLMLGADYLMVQFGRKKATIFSRVMPELEAMDFAKQIDKIVDVSKVKKMVSTIPDSWEACFQRAMLVLEGEADKFTEIADGEPLKLHTKAPMGEADDVMDPDVADFKGTVVVDPGLILRASKVAAKVLIGEQVTILTNEEGSFIHLIAHCQK